MMTDKLAAHIAATVASWPAPTPEQVRRTTLILRRAYAEKMGHDIPAYAPEDPQIAASRKAQDALAKLHDEFTRALDGCHGCGISRDAHKYQEGYGTGYHAFQPLSPDAAIKVARAYKKKIAAAESALEAARRTS